jgi:hypothetical protein
LLWQRTKENNAAGIAATITTAAEKTVHLTEVLLREGTQKWETPIGRIAAGLAVKAAARIVEGEAIADRPSYTFYYSRRARARREYSIGISGNFFQPYSFISNVFYGQS